MLHLWFTDAIQPYLYFSTRREIRKINLRQGSNYTTVLSGLSNTIGIDFDWSEQQLYYSDVNNDKIVRCFLNGSKCEDVISTGLLMSEGKVLRFLQMFFNVFLQSSRNVFLHLEKFDVVGGSWFAVCRSFLEQVSFLLKNPRIFLHHGKLSCHI